MKPLYYLEFARSIDSNNNIIDAKKLNWYTPNQYKIMFEDSDFCKRSRIAAQLKLNNHVVRVKKANFFKGLWVRFISEFYDCPWMIIEN